MSVVPPLLKGEMSTIKNVKTGSRTLGLFRDYHYIQNSLLSNFVPFQAATKIRKESQLTGIHLGYRQRKT